MILGTAVVGALAFVAAPGPAAVAGGTAPSGLDCNGLGAGAPSLRAANYGCTELKRTSADEPAEINDTYVGHDEPLISYYSNKAGSGNNVQFRVKLPVDPAAPPDGTLGGPIHTYQLYPTFWFSMVLCDTQSFPETKRTCKPDSDSNIQVPFKPTHAGTAFLETQFYPPGWSPFITQFSCDQTHWCASMHINSLQGDFDFNLNPNCAEPTAFAFIQRDGHPTGPAGPDDFTDASFTPNSQTLLMNPGDVLRVTIRDTPGGLLNRIDDLTTGQSGFMVGSAKNGFRHIIWDPDNFTCNGEPYTYHPMYATSKAPHGQSPTTWAGWTAHTVNVSASLEIGHFEKPDAHQDPGDTDEGPCFPGPTIPGCIGTDVDFDGYSYHRSYPNGQAKHPTPVLFSSPKSRTHGGGPYTNAFPRLNFETDLPAIEGTCNVVTGEGCTNPPRGAAFYPFPHSMEPSPGFPAGQSCQWTIGANHPQQLDNFGGTSRRAWGPLQKTNFGGGFIASENFATGPFANPCP